MNRRALAGLVIIAAITIVYREAPSAYFFEDDFQWLAGTMSFHPGQLLDIGNYSHFYRPVIELYFWMATPLLDGSPRLFHLANVALHAANGLVLFVLARFMTGSDRFGFLAALFFVVLPGYIEAVAWVSALAEPVGAFFGCLSIYWLLVFRRSGAPAPRALSIAAFFLALMTHESSVVFLPLLWLADRTFARPATGRWRVWPADAGEWIGMLRVYAPYLMVIGGYLLVDLSVNRRNYLIEEGHYVAGVHVIRNILRYLVALYVGKSSTMSFVMVTAAVTVLLLRGMPRVRFATLWMLLALLPFAFFAWGNVSRYLYLPAIGFAMLLAEGAEWLDRWLARRLPDRARTAVVGLIVTAVVVRFMLFASTGVGNFAERTEAYRSFIGAFRQAHPQLPVASRVPIEARLEASLPHRYLRALVQWEYRDPSIELVVRGSGPAQK